MIYFIKELFYIKIYYPLISIIQIIQCLFYCIVATSSRSESITEVIEFFFIYFYNWLGNDLLYNSVQNLWHGNSKKHLITAGI